MTDDFVRIVEVGPRDGLQNEKQVIPAATKIELINRLGATGLKMIEATSFVSPKWVPQLADAKEVLKGITRAADAAYPVLTPNTIGFERAVNAGADHVAVFTAASESFNQRNINCSIEESIERFAPLLKRARSERIPVRGYVSCVLGCPYEGLIEAGQVVDVAERLLDIGCNEISLGDTIGAGTARDAAALIRLVAASISTDRLAVHFHDTRGQALANILTCLDEGIRIVDSSVAGLGGCPYANGATGNVATEDVIYMLHGMGLETGVDLEALIETGHFICDALGRDNGSKVGRAGTFPRATEG